MFCKYCGNQLSDDAIFCPKCGKKVERESVSSAPSAAAEETQKPAASVENAAAQNPENQTAQTKVEPQPQPEPKQEEWTSISKNGRRFVYKPSEPNKFYCPKCHSRVADTDSLCSNCNESLIESSSSSSSSSPTYFETPQSYSQNHSDEKSAEDENERLMEAYCRGKPYFINVFKKMDRDGKNSWNWAAFFFNMWYLCYKKMWGWGFLVWIIVTALQLAGAVGYVISLGVAIVCGIFANTFYYQRYQKLLSDSKVLFPTFEGRKRYLYDKGGSSAGAVILILLMIAGYVAFGVAIGIALADYGYNSVNNYYY